MARSRRSQTAARTRATYDRVAGRFLENTRDRTASVPWLDRFAADLGPGALALDLGAGPCTDTHELRRRGLRAVGLDLSMGMLRSALAELPGPRVQGDLLALPFPDGCAAGVWANATLLHLEPEELDGALAEFARVLRPGGLAHVSVKLGTGGEWETQRYGEPRWFRYWSGEALDRRLVDAGFHLLEASKEEGRRRETWLVRLLQAPGEPGDA